MGPGATWNSDFATWSILRHLAERYAACVDWERQGLTLEEKSAYRTASDWEAGQVGAFDALYQAIRARWLPQYRYRGAAFSDVNDTWAAEGTEREEWR